MPEGSRRKGTSGIGIRMYNILYKKRRCDAIIDMSEVITISGLLKKYVLL